MKKLVYVMMAITALSFASCDKTATNDNQSTQDSITATVDSVNADATAADQDTAAEVTDTQAPAEGEAPEAAAATESK